MLNKIKIPEITNDLAYLCGVLAGDGCIYVRPEKSEYEVSCVGILRMKNPFILML